MFSEQIIKPLLQSINSFPDRNAFCINKKYYTYRQLSQEISKVRKAVRVNPHSHKEVGLVINDDIETYASVFALWMEGECYVPLHPGWPLERCQDIIDQVDIDCILDSSDATRYEGNEKYKVIQTSNLESEENNLEFIEVDDEDLAYILFTSGSTGKPKGVMLTRRNIASFMDSFWKTGIDITEEDRCLQCFDLTFDVSIQSYLVPLTRGACCYTVPYGKTKYLYACGLIEDYRLTFGAMAPSMLRYLKPYFEEIDATSLKTCILTAEACPLSLMDDWYNCATNTEIYDFYGPTECTIYCTYYKLTKGGDNKSLNGIISVGKPLANCVGLILDEQGNELPAGEKGELCIAGDQVTKGYWKNDEKNASSFFYKEVNGVNMRFYHTGDLCYKDEDGDIMYSGRLDHQAKIQGFRVEMGEIEYHATKYLGGNNTVCLAFDNKEGLTQIAMFVEGTDSDSKNEMLEYLRTKMPQYMIPSRVYYLKVFPINDNGKTDKVKLKTMITI